MIKMLNTIAAIVPDMRQFIRILNGGVAVALLGVGLSACDPTEADPRLKPPLVRVAIAQPAVSSERAFTGVISARIQSNLGFRVGGKIIERLVDTGQPVKLGQPLMKLDRADLDLAIAARDKAVEAARATAVQARADEARYRKLLADGWATHQRYEQAKSTLDNAEAQLAAAEANAQVAKNEGDYSVLLADADGVIVETLGEPGQVVAAGQIVIRLAHTGPREATVNLPEAIRPAIGSGASATVYSDPRSGSPARLRQLSDAADPVSRTYEARYVLEGAAAEAPLGATVTLRIPDDSLVKIVEVPLGAIVDKGATSGVWLIDQSTSTVTFRPVKLAGLGEETARIKQGLAVGDQVVAIGAHLLHEGESVRAAGTETASR
jgi:RND family efflux transporter MFP subunit